MFCNDVYRMRRSHILFRIVIEDLNKFVTLLLNKKGTRTHFILGLEFGVITQGHSHSEAIST